MIEHLRRNVLLASLAVLLGWTASTWAQGGDFVVPRDNVGPAVAATAVVTGEISGTVFTTGTPRAPLRRVSMTLRDTDRGATRVAVTDAKGAFVFQRLADGRYTLAAAKPAYISTSYGARTPRGQALTIALAAGQRVTNLALNLARGAVLTGRVTDAQGRAISGVRVTAAERLTVGGEASYRPAGGIGSATDDLGVFRLYGLPAGSYILAASLIGGFGNAPRATTAEEVQWALKPQTSAPGTTRAADSGSPPPGRPVSYATAFYPSVSDVSAATAVTVADGEEKGGLDFTVPLVPTATIRGMVTRFDGQPVRGPLVVATPMARAIAGVSLLTIPPRANVMPNGEFTMSGLEPGRYLVSARASSLIGPPQPGPGGARGGAAPPGNDLWATAEITVSGDDVSGVRLELAPGMSVTGRFVFEGSTPPPAVDSNTANVSLSVPPGTGAALGASASQINADGTFAFSSVPPGSFFVTSALRGTAASTAGLAPPAWMLKSATFNGQDVLDTPLDIRSGADVSGIVVTYTDRVTQISGLVTDQNGRPAPTYSVIVFSTESRHWRRLSRWVRQPVRPDSNGRFAINALPPGEYYLAVLSQFDPNEWSTPAFLQQVVPGAIKITIGEGEKKTQDLKLGA